MGFLDTCKPVMAMIALQSIDAGLLVCTRAAFVQGLNPRILVVYRQIIATLIMAPIAYFSRRKASSRTSMGVKAFAWLFLAAFFGLTVTLNAYFEGVSLSSSTIASAMTNTIPAVTFVVAVSFGFEKVSIQSYRSISKVIGTVICVGGAIALALLKGPKILNQVLLPPQYWNGSGGEKWLLGSLLLFVGSCSWSTWLILQVPMSRSCPHHLLSTSWMCFFGAIQSALLTVFIEQDPEAWKLQSGLDYASCLLTGVITAVSILVQAWCVSQRGPLFTAMFNPLGTVFVTILAAIFLHEKIYLASLLGALAVIIGLYVVLWGKSEDLKEMDKDKETSKMEEEGQPSNVQVVVDDHYLESNLGEPLMADKTP